LSKLVTFNDLASNNAWGTATQLSQKQLQSLTMATGVLRKGVEEVIRDLEKTGHCDASYEN
jgi:hypothetical protein